MSPCLRRCTGEELAEQANAINNIKDRRTAPQGTPGLNEVPKQAHFGFSSSKLLQEHASLQRPAHTGLSPTVTTALVQVDPGSGRSLWTKGIPCLCWPWAEPAGQARCSAGYQKQAGRVSYLGTGADGFRTG